MRQQHWSKDSPVARLMEALVHAAPKAMRIEKGKQSAAAKFPEFRAWHDMLEPLFGIAAPDWTEKAPPQRVLFPESAVAEEELDYDEEEDLDEESEE